jgi:hypothetical protein
MPEFFATEVAGTESVPNIKASGAIQGGRLRRFRATIEYDGQAAADTIVLANVPAGYAFSHLVMNASATAGASATIAIGTAASSGKYRAAATFTAANTPTLFGNAAAVKADPLTAPERVIATIAAAALPNSADFCVVDLYFTAP